MSHSNLTERQGEAIGNGTWYTIHLMAKEATTDRGKEAFIVLMHNLAKSYWCEKCRRHINEYLQQHPIQLFWHYRDVDGNEIGMFKWAWSFHNAVNRRLGKAEVPWETARAAYYEPSFHICNQACADRSSRSQNRYSVR